MDKTKERSFDREYFAELLNRAFGGRTQTKFAKDSGLTTAYICRYANGKCETPPRPSTLKKMATASYGVSYGEFLEAAGYDPGKYTITQKTGAGSGKRLIYAEDLIERVESVKALNIEVPKWLMDVIDGTPTAMPECDDKNIPEI